MKSNDRYSTIVVLMMAGIGLYFYARFTAALYFVFALGLLCVLVPVVASYVHTIWMWIALKTGVVSSTILLTIVYFIILLPLAVIRRLRRSSSLQLKKSEDTYFTTRNHTYVKSDLEDMW